MHNFRMFGFAKFKLNGFFLLDMKLNEMPKECRGKTPLGRTTG